LEGKINVQLPLMAISCVLHLVNELWGYDVEFQQDVVKKIFTHDLMKPLLLKHLANLVEIKHNQTIVDNIRSGGIYTFGKGTYSKTCCQGSFRHFNHFCVDNKW
jgi:hypothetical protein